MPIIEKSKSPTTQSEPNDIEKSLHSKFPINNTINGKINDENTKSLEDKKLEIFNNSLICYKKASLLEIVNDKVLKKALIFPNEVKSTRIIESLKEKATIEKNEKRKNRYLMKRGKLIKS